MADTAGRLLLRVSVKLLFLLALGFSLYALFSSLNNDSQKHPLPDVSLLHTIETIPEDQTYRIAWNKGNLILLRRSNATLAALNKESERLLDPLSRYANQPPYLPTDTRSINPELFIAFDRGTDMGCPLEWVAPGNRKSPFQPWPGGFRDSCRGSWYDAAGRVFKGQQAARNLDIPPYRFRGKDLLEIGASGDNPTPAK